MIKANYEITVQGYRFSLSSDPEKEGKKMFLKVESKISDEERSRIQAELDKMKKDFNDINNEIADAEFNSEVMAEIAEDPAEITKKIIYEIETKRKRNLADYLLAQIVLKQDEIGEEGILTMEKLFSVLSYIFSELPPEICTTIDILGETIHRDMDKAEFYETFFGSNPV